MDITAAAKLLILLGSEKPDINVNRNEDETLKNLFADKTNIAFPPSLKHHVFARTERTSRQRSVNSIRAVSSVSEMVSTSIVY